VKQTLRIQFLVNSLVIGGAERVVEELCLRLPERGFEVGVGAMRAAGPIGERLRARGLAVDEDLAPDRSDLFQIRDLARYLRERQPDLLYFLDHSNALFYGVLAKRFAGRPPAVLAVHRTGREDGSPSLSLSDRLLLRGVDAVVAVSNSHRDYLRDLEGVSGEKLHVVFNGVDAAAYETRLQAGEKAARRAEFGLPAAAMCVALVAALRPEKNHALALDAFSRLGPQFHLVLVGDGALRAHLEAEAAALQLEGRVHFLGARDDVPRVLACMDALLLSSHPRVETFPLCVLEAMAAQLPVVATDVGSLHEMLLDGETGRLVPPGDAAALAVALRQVLEDEPAGRESGRRGRQRVAEQFSVDRMVDGTARILRELRLLRPT
jgi:glycosyltransferase involved in cell wall biosynthesis